MKSEKLFDIHGSVVTRQVVGEPTVINLNEECGATMRIHANADRSVSIGMEVEAKDFTVYIVCETEAKLDRIVAAILKARDEAFGGHDRARRVNGWRNVNR